MRFYNEQEQEIMNSNSLEKLEKAFDILDHVIGLIIEDGRIVGYE